MSDKSSLAIAILFIIVFAIDHFVFGSFLVTGIFTWIMETTDWVASLWR